MVKCCDTCGSIVIGGACSNDRCGSGNRVKWARTVPPRLASALTNGSLALVTAPRSSRAADLGGPPIGMTAPAGRQTRMAKIAPEPPDAIREDDPDPVDEEAEPAGGGGVILEAETTTCTQAQPERTRMEPSKTCTLSRMAPPGHDGFSPWECSRCLDRWDWDEESWQHIRYCPNCGAMIVLKDALPLP